MDIKWTEFVIKLKSKIIDFCQQLKILKLH